MFPSVLRKAVIRKAVQPALPRLRRCNHGVTTRPRMLAGVLVGRVITALRRPALLTGPEVHPPGACLYTLFTFPAGRVADGRDRGDVGAGSVRHGHDSEGARSPCW
jgi:hypothetical protein